MDRALAGLNLDWRWEFLAVVGLAHVIHRLQRDRRWRWWRRFFCGLLLFRDPSVVLEIILDWKASFDSDLLVDYGDEGGNLLAGEGERKKIPKTWFFEPLHRGIQHCGPLPLGSLGGRRLLGGRELRFG